jgi:hypothetical protein
MPRYYYLISSLPALPGLGEKVLLGPAELREQVAGEAALAPLIDLVLLEDDLFLRQSVLAGEQGEAVPAVLSPEQVGGEQPLPSFLQADEPGEGPLGEDPVWEAYFRHVDQQGRRMGSTFLQAWAAFEVGLRNRLVQVRAKALHLSVDAYLVAPELGRRQEGAEEVIERWQGAENPLAAQRALDQGRMGWLLQRGGWFTFSAYARGLALAVRWERLAAAERRRSAEEKE